MQSERFARPSPVPTRTETITPDLEAARVELEATNAQLRAMQALTDTALSHLALDDLLREMLDRVTAVLAVDGVAILLVDGDGQALTLRAARGLSDEESAGAQLHVGQGFPGKVAARRIPMIVDALAPTDFDGAPSALRERMHSAAGAPLVVENPALAHRTEGQLEGRLIGVLVVSSAAPRHFTEADVELLQRAADRIALAVDRVRLYAAEQDTRRCVEGALARAQASEAQATERVERLNTILDTMTDGVAVYDAEGYPLQLVNRAYRELVALDRGPAGYEALPSYERAGLLDVRDIDTGEPLPFERSPIGRALRGEVVTGPSADVCIRAFDGRELVVNSSAAPLWGPDGRVVGAVLVLRDLTERKRLAHEQEAARADELAAREASRRLEAFLATAAHDLRTPLTATVGFLHLAQLQTERLAAAAASVRSDDFDRQIAVVRDRLNDAFEGAERLTRLLSVLFDTAAFRAGKLMLHLAPRDLVVLVREQVATLRMAAPDRSIRVHMPAGDEPIVAEADADRIGEVVMNYVTNALKYSPPDQPVDVSVTAREGRVRVAVCDQGPGMPTEERARVWELFHRVPGVTVQGESHGGSLGLGLYICKAIVTAHGGRVGVKSAVGQGSTFWFTLPLSSRAA